MRKTIALISFTIFVFAGSICSAKTHHSRNHHKPAKTISKQPAKVIVQPVVTSTPDSVSSEGILSFAQSLLGIRYRASSSNPLHGFDCSGFVSYVFKSFNFIVPRSSNEFINIGRKINITDAKPGDIILFTGTKTHHPHSIGHVGIICSIQDGLLKFIHSTSGKEHGVTITDFNDTYKRRFVQVVRLLKLNDDQQ